MGADIKGQTMAALPGTIDAMNEQASKACTKCGVIKLLPEFGSDKRAGDGRDSACKTCRNRQKIEWSHANRQRCAAYSLAYQKRHPDRARQCRADWRERNKDKVIAAAKALNDKNVALCTPSYCASAMRIPLSELTPELLALKREQLTIRRLARQLKEKANESSTDPR
jgi:hypothetical protein